MSVTYAGTGSAPCPENENNNELLNELCSQLNVPMPEDGFSTELIGVLFSAITCIPIPKDLSPLELIHHVLRTLSNEVIRSPLDHLDAAELLQKQPEAVQDLLEILLACVPLRDTETSTIASVLWSDSVAASGGITVITSGESLAESISNSSSSSSSSLLSSSSFGKGGRHKDSPLGSSISCSSCDSISSDLSSCASSLSEPTQDIQLPCPLCQYLARFSFEPEPAAPNLQRNGNENGSVPTRALPDNKSSTSAKQLPPQQGVSMPGPSRSGVLVGNPRASAPAVKSSTSAAQTIRPSKVFRLTSQKHGERVALEERRELRQMANTAKRKFNEEKKLTMVKRHEKPMKVVKKNVIPNRPTTLRPVPMVPPEPAFPFGTYNGSTARIEEGVAGSECASVESSEVSPHLLRVLRKQYNQHLQWMTSHGTSEAGLRKLQVEYEDLLERHTARVNQIHKELCEQARLTALNTQKGVAASVRNLRAYARTQEQQLAHAHLEMERIERSKEARRRLAEERLLRETFTETMRLQKTQLLDLNRELAEKRGRERDRHNIYMQGMEHFYRTQLDMLQEALQRETRDGRIRTGAQIALLRDMRKELQSKLDEEMKNLREIASMDFDRAFDSPA